MKKLIFVFLLLVTIFISIPISAYTFDSTKDKVYLGGETVGLKLNTGVVISKTFAIADGTTLLKPWALAGIKEKDIILSYNDYSIKEAKDLLEAIQKSGNKTVPLLILRGNKKISTTITPVLKDEAYSLGIYIKDNIMGVGTLTYIMPETNIFGALGHQIDGSTDADGKMYEATVVGIQKGVVGEAGSKRATISTKTIGTIEKNTITGIHGTYSGKRNERKLIAIGKQKDVHKGYAQVVTCVHGDEVDYYDIEITSVIKQNKQDIKGIKFEVTDPLLLAKTGGIIQGMSGSPIIQDDKIIGAVTHVLVNNPKEGYGIFIEFMLYDMGIDVI